MSIEPINETTVKTTHRYHTHSNHRSSTLLVEQLVQTAPQFTACYTNTALPNAALATAASEEALDATTVYECPETPDASHELLDYYLNDSIGSSSNAKNTAFDRLDLKLDTLDFSLTRRLLGAVFFLLIIYAWKQYIDDEEESDTIYI